MGPGRQDVAPGASPEWAELVAMVRANKIPPRQPRKGPLSAAQVDKEWRLRKQSHGGHVTTVSLTPAAWKRVQEVRAWPTSDWTSSDAVSALMAMSVVLLDGPRKQAAEILREYPSMGTIDEVIRVAVGHLLFRIRQDPDYIVATE